MFLVHGRVLIWCELSAWVQGKGCEFRVKEVMFFGIVGSDAMKTQMQ